MGQCCAKETSDVHEIETNRSIDKQIKTDERRMKTEVKLLLLGAGESGKSTVLKQMRLLHAAGFSASERESYRVIVFSNIFSIMQTLLEIIQQLDLEIHDEQLQEDARSFFREMPPLAKDEPFPRDYLDVLKELWADEGIQNAYEHGNSFALHDNVPYFYTQLDRLWEPEYLPTDQDIIRCRAKTTGIVETIFHLGPLTYRMVDVGGQRSERKKWIHCFDNVTAILFVVAISGYDQCLVEDRDSNQMLEALMLFDSICNSPWFVKTSMILFLNKIDIFREKIKVSPISQYFPDYQGIQYRNISMTRLNEARAHPVELIGPDDDVDQICVYFRKRFQRLNHNPSKRIYCHYTDATDSKLLEHVMYAVSDIILNENLNTFIL